MSLLHHGFNKIVIINGHGGNVGAIKKVIRQIREETGKIVHNILVWCTNAGFGRGIVHVIEQKGSGHACEEETGTSLYLGQRVLMEKVEKWSPPEGRFEIMKKYGGSFITARMMNEAR